MRTLPLPAIAALLATSLAAFAADKGKPDRAQIEEGTRLQIFLDRANFGPGKIDGRPGEFTRKALALYRKATAGTASSAGTAGTEKNAAPVKDSEAAPDTMGLDLASVGMPFTSYAVTAEDTNGIGEIPKDRAAQAKLKAMPYRSVLEGIAEKFHADVDFIKELNPNVNTDALKEGDQLTVPNVQPFELAAVKEIKPGEAFASTRKGDDSDAGKNLDAGAPKNAGGAAAKATGKADDGAIAERGAKKESDVKSGSAEEAAGDADANAPAVTLHLNVSEKMLHVRQGEKLIAAFPVTPGSDAIPTPTGDWKVKGVARMPDFRYDEKMLKEGQRSDDAYILPPGPNNPVGVVWVALNKPGIGIHGTDDPDTIGRAASHGCVRLANWDAAKLARMVKAGVAVTIE